MKSILQYRRQVSANAPPGLAYIITLFILSQVFLVSNSKAQCTIAFPSDTIQYALGASCEDTLTVDNLGVTTQGCMGPFTINASHNGINYGDIITSDHIGLVMMVTIEDAGGNNNMGLIEVVDNQAPIVDCTMLPDDTISCYTVLDSVPGLTAAAITECSEYDITPFDVPENYPCDSLWEAIITRTFIIEDIYGNNTSCTQLIYRERADINNVVFPFDTTLYCGPGLDTTPTATGIPTYDNYPVDNGYPCNLFATYDDVVVPLPDCGYKVMRTWIINEWCEPDADTMVQQITVKDTTPPVIIAPADLTVGTSELICAATVELQPAIVTDICSNTSVIIYGLGQPIFSNGGVVNDVVPGLYNVIYEATDDCFLSSTDTMTVTVVDDNPPTAICELDLVVSLNSSGTATVPAENFDNGSTDACGPVWFKVKRMSPPTGYSCETPGNPQNWFHDEITFCCEDVSQGEIMVILRVYDVNPWAGPISDGSFIGHFNDCMIPVTIQDKLPPSITAPDDITIDCHFLFDPADLEVFGSVVTDVSLIEPIVIDGDTLGYDGLVTDNCGFGLSTDSTFNIGDCGTGSITRTFIATDDNEVQYLDEQTITIVNTSPFDSTMITWPVDTNITSCNGPLDTANTGAPTWTYDLCSTIGISYTDDIFYQVPGVCFKILRTWKIIDWCQYDHIQGTGLWSDYQVIKVSDNEAPVISLPANFLYESQSTECGPIFINSLPQPIATDCTPEADLQWVFSIDMGNDGIVDHTGVGYDVSRMYGVGEHNITYVVNDRCGNSTAASMILEVVDAKRPTALMINGFAAELMEVPGGGMITIEAFKFDGGSWDNCTDSSDLRFSYSTNVTNTEKTFTCDDLGEQLIPIYVWDLDGNYDFTYTTIDIQDNNNVCPGSITNTISGMLFTSNGTVMPSVNVEVNAGNVSENNMTDESGLYSFPDLATGQNYQVKPEYDLNHLDGVSTLDLILIQKHILGLQSFNDPIQYLAADVNRSNSVSTSDIIEIRKLILGISSEFSNTDSWRFMDEDYVFNDPDNPLNETVPDSYVVENFQQAMLINFTGIKTADIDGDNSVSNIESSEDRTNPFALIMDIKNNNGNHVINFYPSSDIELSGMQCALKFSDNVVDATLQSQVLDNLNADFFAFNTERNELRLSWNDQATMAKTSKPVFSIHVEATDNDLPDIHLYDQVIKSELYSETGEVFPLTLQQKVVQTQSDLSLSISPNPANKQVKIQIDGSTSDLFEVSLSSIDGREFIPNFSQDLHNGSFTLELSEWGIAPGLYILHCRVGDKILSEKLVITDEK